MNDYQKNIEQQLSEFMPSFALMPINEMEEYIKDAPKVEGYFKFISIKYMKSVKTIKKLCIEYINTYIEGALNLAKNMDDVKLQEAQDSIIKEDETNLAKTMDFKKAGASTSGEEKEADTKTGVLFLTGDKALKDKLDAIVLKIQTRAKKSEALTEWAKLMILQSKIQANDFIFGKTNEMIKDEKVKEERAKKAEERKKQNEEKKKKLEEEHKKYQKELDKMLNSYGEISQWFDKDIPTASELSEYAADISANDLDKELVSSDDATKLDEDGPLNSKRIRFYNAYKNDGVSEAIKMVDDYPDKDSLNNIQKNFLFACTVTELFSNDGKFIASPADLSIVVANDKEANDLLKASGNDKIYKGVKFKLENFKSNDLKPDEATKLRKNMIKARDFAQKAVFCWSRLFSDKECKIKEQTENYNESIHVMTSKQFITEEMIQNTMTLRDASNAILDVLDECEDGCMYVGNIPGAEEVDYIMMDGYGGWGFYKELGNLKLALENGAPQEVEPIMFSDSETLAILNCVFEKLSEELLDEEE